MNITAEKENLCRIRGLSNVARSVMLLLIYLCLLSIGYLQAENKDDESRTSLLIQDLKSILYERRLTAARELEDIKDPRAVEILISVLKNDVDSQVRGEAQQEL